ncbi:17870_t:CDS:2 [Funneliformis caledonium]|uniref:17870_t:CDS:1 n=1 Tax=Funneliformis caledonium TaxID=1117310 RepID=A0A9N9ICM8_9GLOM|nr:17870_t:CDS:2 [Funneliformis caledonium]
MSYTGREATPGTILTIISFLLLFLINLLTPIIKTLYFVKVSRLGLTFEEELTIGLWGFCAHINGTPKKCTPTKIGFAFDPRKSLNPNLIPGGLSQDLPEAVSTSLSYLVVVHILALITLSIVSCVGVFAHRRKNRDKGLIKVAAQSSTLAFILVLFAFIIDFILFNNGIVKPINKMVGNVYTAKLDNAYYLMIVCLISSGLATIGFLVGKVMNKRRRRKSDDDDIYDNRETIEPAYQRPNNERVQNPNQNNIPQYAEYEVEEIRQSPSPVNRPLPSNPGVNYSNPTPILPGPKTGVDYFNPSPYAPGPQPGVEYPNPSPYSPGPQQGVEYSNPPSFVHGPQQGVEYSNPSPYSPGSQHGAEYSNPPPFVPGPQHGVEYSNPSNPFGPQPGSEFSYQSQIGPTPYQGHTSPIRRTPGTGIQNQFAYSHQSPHQSPSYPNAYDPYSTNSPIDDYPQDPQDGYPLSSNQPSYTNPNIYHDQSEYHKPPGNYYKS